MAKNKKVMSIAIVPDLHEELKRYSKRKGLSASSYVGELIEQAVKLNIDDDPVVIGKPVDEDVLPVSYNKDEVSPVILKIPVNVREDQETLKKWLAVQMSGILKAMVKKNDPVE
ncbi:MAG: hypothetical protein ACXADO_06940 [Candidatus Thorarchaeota archaeon]|jgi:hypothetical protein